MVNRNAARHLALVVSILLCFFVYMGYRFRGQSENRDNAAAAPDSAVPVDVAQSQNSLMTMGDNQSSGLPSVLLPVNTPSGAPPAQGGAASVPSLPLQPETTQSSLKPPSSSLPPPPSGSFEEAQIDSGDPDAIITGLIPDSGVTLPIPGLLSDASSDESESGSQTAVSLAPPSEGLRPQTSDSAGGSAGLSLPPPPATEISGSDAGSGQALIPPPGRTTPPAANDPLPQNGRQSPALQPPASGANGIRPGAQPGTSVATGPRATPGQAGNAPGPANNGRGGGSESLRIYVVRPGDTLSRIAATELGSIALADNIFLLNRDVISDPDHLVVGVRIRLPVRDTAGGQDVATGPSVGTGPGLAPTQTGVRQPGRIHIVARGDTLSSIALRYYGSSTAWRFLYEANASIITNPNRLVVGMELMIPPYGERP